MGAGASTEPTNKRAVLVCHSSQEQELRRRLAQFDIVEPLAIVTERHPRGSQARADVFARVGAVVLAVDAAFQRSPRLVETVSLLKDTRRDVLAGPLTFYSRPSGAVGAICCALGVWDPMLFSIDNSGRNERGAAMTATVLVGLNFLTASEVERVVASTQSDSNAATVAAQDCVFGAALPTDDTNECDRSTARVLYVYAGADGELVATTFAALDHTQTSVDADVILAVVDIQRCACSSLANDLHALARAHVAVFVITSDSIQDATYRRLFDAAVRWRKPLLPIHVASAGPHFPGWLAVAMAGRLWYQVVLDALEQIHTPYAELPNCACKVHDSCLAKDFLQCLHGLLADSVVDSPCSLDDSVEHDDTALWATREDACSRLCRERACVAGKGMTRKSIDALCATVRDLVSVFSSSSNNEDKDTATQAHARQQLEALGVAMTPAAVATQTREEDAAAALATTLLPTALLPREPKPGDFAVTMVHYTSTRTSERFPPVSRVVDTNGLPLPNLALDAMFSYQWSAQQRVLDVYMQCTLRNLRVWFDVFGYMQGNVNAAMATAVEHVACVVVFLSHAYVQSVNCRLEFQYARQRGKPIVFAFLDDPHTLVSELPEWIIDAVGTRSFSVYPSMLVDDNDSESEDAAPLSHVLALDLTCDAFRGVPMIGVLLSAVRQLADARQRGEPRTIADGSLLLYATTRALRHALTVSCATRAVDADGDRSNSCTATLTACVRCGATFDATIESTLHGCRKHRAYYVGGTVMAGRWVCCHELSKDGVGCESATHITGLREWMLNPSYGTYTYEPA